MQLKNRKTKKKYLVIKREKHLLSTTPGKWLAIDFVMDRIRNSRNLKVLTVIDPVTNEVPAITPEYSMCGEDVMERLEGISREQGYPEYLQSDNGPEFRSYELSQWCEHNHVTQVFSRPGKPTDNCFIESFNGTLRDECLNVYYFETLDSAKEIIEKWRLDYNEKRPQKRFQGLTPVQYKNRILERKTTT